MTFPINRFSELTALVVGDVMIDAYLWGDVERQSPEAPVPVLLKSGKDSRIGGAGNVARNVLAMGAKAHLATVIGNDISGKYLQKILIEKGIGTRAVITEHARTTTVKTRIIKGTEHMLRIDEETTEQIIEETRENLKNQISSLLDSENIDVIIVEDYDKGVMSPELASVLIEHANSKGIPITVDPKLKNFEAYKGATLFKPNLKELKEGLGLEVDPNDLSSLQKATDKLNQTLQAQISLTTLGSDGMVINAGGNLTHVSATIRNVVDVSGAGDTVIAVASLMLALGESPENIAKASNIAGGQVCEKSGVVTVDLNELSSEF